MADPVSTTNLALGLVDRIIRFFTWLRGKAGGKKVPYRRISFVPQRHMWCNANIGDRPAMQLMSDWWVTNPEKEHLYILRAEVRLWRGLRKYVFNQMQLIEKGRSGMMDEVRLLLFIEPRFCNSEAESFSATVVMIDNFNRRHHVGKVLFRGVKAPQFPA